MWWWKVFHLSIQPGSIPQYCHVEDAYTCAWHVALICHTACFRLCSAVDSSTVSTCSLICRTARPLHSLLHPTLHPPITRLPHPLVVPLVVKVLGKPIEAVADEFAEANLLHVGDVRYHCGTYADVDVSVRTGAEGAQGSGGKGGKKGTRTVHVSLAANPSHLEMVGPVVVGKTKAKQIYADDAMDRGNERNQEMQVRGEGERDKQGYIPIGIYRENGNRNARRPCHLL